MKAAPFWDRRIVGHLPTADGVRLRYSALLPAGDGPFPAILNYSGYDPGIIGGPAYARGETKMSIDLDRLLIEHGFAVVGVNVRGTGCSEGRSAFLEPEMATDGRDAVEFVAAQPWCSGSVGMANMSYAGITQIATAIERPPHLAAIAPGMVVCDLRLDSWAPGGVPQFGFALAVDARHNPLPARHEEAALADGDEIGLAALQARAAGRPGGAFSDLLLAHPTRDAWVVAQSMHERAGGIDVPVLSMEAFQDEQTGPRGGYYQETIRPDLVWVVQTNGPHEAYFSRWFWTNTLLPFLQRFVKGDDNGFDARPRVEIWQESWTNGSDARERMLSLRPEWIVSRDFPPPVTPTTFHFDAGGRLSKQPPEATGADGYRYPVEGATMSVSPEGQAFGEPPRGAREGSLAYTTDPFGESQLLYGPASVDLWISTTCASPDLQVTLTEVSPEGDEIYVQRGWLRLAARTLDPRWSTPLRPVPTDDPGDLAAALPGVAVLARVELPKFSHPFRPGSRLRLWIEAPSATGMSRFDYWALPGVNRIHWGGAEGSRLVVARLEGVDVPPLRAAHRDERVGLPARRDPLRATIAG